MHAQQAMESGLEQAQLTDICSHLSWRIKELIQAHINQLSGRDGKADDGQRPNLHPLVTCRRAAQRKVQLILPAHVRV